MKSKNQKYVIALDQGTTSSRAILVGEDGEIHKTSQKEFTQVFPKEGWVEHNPEEIWTSQLEVLTDLFLDVDITPDQITSIGITNQRETVILWDKRTGEPVYNAIVWQDLRTTSYCEELKKVEGLRAYIRSETGLVIDAYFSATKIKWILENVDKAAELEKNGNLCFGTVDSWLIWKLTKGKVHATDYTNASRTMIFNIKNLDWDQKLLSVVGVPKSILPAVQPSASYFGDFELEGVPIPITGVAGDQQAALFGQLCFEPGMAKNTYGTGCFLLMNTGADLIASRSGLLTTLACSLDKQPIYALEGSIFIAGAAIQWLRDGMKVISAASQTEALAYSSADSEVVVVPAFSGLGAPYWNMQARGTIFGITRDTGIAELAKATLESLAYQTHDVLSAMVEDTGIELEVLKVDGGASANNYLMQFQSDMLNVKVERPSVIESTAMGAAYLAGIQSGVWSVDDIRAFRKVEKIFEPRMSKSDREKKKQNWDAAISAVASWTEAKTS